MAVDWLTRLGKKGFETLVSEIVEKVLDKVLQNRVEPRLVGIENRLAKLEAEVAMLKSNR